MKRAIFLPLLCLALAVMAQPRQEIYLEKGWRFTRGDISGAADPADRAGAVALGSIEKVVEVQLRLAGGPREITQNVNVEEFVKQADYYDTLQNNTWDKLLQNYAILGASHPFTAIRVREILKWGKTEQCQRILKNIKLEQDGLICPNCGKPLEKDWIYCKHCGFKLK